MKLWRTRERAGVDPDHELRSLRPRPSDELVASVVAGVRASRGPVRFGRLGVALALTGLVVISVASFGGISYASGKAGAPRTSASAQYAPVKPPPKGTGATTTAPPKSSGLPFTGLTLWVPLAGGIVLMVLGVGLRWQGRRRTTSN